MMNKVERLEDYTNAVIAIVITLMVLVRRTFLQ